VILLVAATDLELCGHEGLVCGVGPVEAAAATATELALRRTAAVLHVGLAGGRGLAPGTLVVGSESRYCDLAAAIPVVDCERPHPALLERVVTALPDAELLPIGTSAAVGGVPHDVSVEAMEGFGVLRAAARAGVPAVEVRAVSNEVGEPERARWDVGTGLEALRAALPRLLAALDG
jgi:nucleoside phosphorylase